MRRLAILLLLLGAGGWAALHSYRQQSSLHQQLEQLTAVLTVENDRVAKETQNTIKGIQAATAKNRNQPADIALLRRAEGLQACVNDLVTMLRDSGGHLRAGNRNSPPLRHLSISATELVLGQGTSRRQAIEQQLATYLDSLRELSRATAAPFLVPVFDNTTPVIDALADLSQLESEVLNRQTKALKRIAKTVGARSAIAHPLVTATAESNVVAPGDTYRAQLGLVGYVSANELRMHMACNGHAVPTTPEGTGLVRFRAPTYPGPATWTGTIRINQNGRDTTFRVTVPYRVARR